MKGNRKKWLMAATAFIIVFSAVVVTGCRKSGAKDAEAADAMPRIVVGGDVQYPPFNYLDEDGQATGIDIELATEAFHRMGYQPEFVTIDWEQKKQLVDSGEIDCIWGCFSMQGRENDYKWAGPYMISRQVVAVAEDSKIYTLQDLEDKTIAVQVTTKPEGILLRHEDARIPQVRNVLSLQNRELIYTMLDKGYVDAIAAHETSILQYMSDYKESYRILEEPLLVVGLGAAFSLNDDRGIEQELSVVMDEMRADGTTEQIISKYLPDAAEYLEVEQLEK